MILKMGSMLEFTQLYDKLRHKEVSIQTAYKLVLLVRAIDTELAFYREKFQELIQQYGKHDDNGNLVFTDDGMGIKLIPEKELEFYNKKTELDQLDFSVPDIQITLDELGDIKLSPEEMNMLFPFIK